MKDLFSSVAEGYAKFRPAYPTEVYDFLFDVVPGNEKAWDCGTGNGQVAVELSKRFKEVYATDISQQQLQNAAQKENVFYSKQPAEHTSFPDKSFDLITVAQAIHWFDFEKFYAEVRRTAKRKAVFAVIGYGLFKCEDYVNGVIQKLEDNYTGSYWDAETKYLDEDYRTIPFPFNEIKTPSISQVYDWTSERLAGYLNTWSAVGKYIKTNGVNPVELMFDSLTKGWEPGATKQIRFEILLRAGIIE